MSCCSPFEKALIPFLLVALCGALSIVTPAHEGAQEERPSSEAAVEGIENEVLENVEGTVKKVGNFGYGLVPDSDPGTRYAPTEPLGESFREDGLRVRFSGELGDPSEIRGRRWGTPLRVTHIERLEG